MSQPVNKDSILLFNPNSANDSSPAFELRGQRTIVAVGMEEGDFITFEVLKINAGDRARYCGCILTPAMMAELEGVQELQCPACEELTQRPVRLTPQNPIVVLDSPQGALLRAIYHGTGLAARAVNVWAAETQTKDLTDTMRGCPPIYYADEDQTWVDTGQFRCLPDGETIEYEQINDCGRRRWFADPERPQIWVDTCCPPRCLPDGETTEIEQRNQCGNTRWIEGEAQVWYVTGAVNCLPDGETTEVEERNQCGQSRWVAGPAQNWVDTGNVRCLDDQETMEVEQINQCGQRRWGPTDTLQDWQPTGIRKCGVDDVEIQEMNQCGQKRWTVCGSVSWIATGETRCIDNVLQRQEINQCGILRWVLTAEFCGDSEHVVASLVVNPEQAPHETTFCWTLTLDAPVQGEPLHLQAVFSGSEQDLESYAYQSATIYPGQISAQFCIASGSHAAEHELCLEVLPHARLSGIPAPVCATITVPEDGLYEIVTVEPDLEGETITEGDDACWTVTLDRPVEDEDLEIEFALTGSEQAIHGYTPPTLVIEVGSDTGQVCVETTDDLIDEPTRQLCLEALENPRISAAPGPNCIDVEDNDEPGVGDSVHEVLSVTVDPEIADEGTEFCWTVTLDSPVAGSDLLVVGELSGDEQDINTYPNPSVVIPIGETVGIMCVTTTDDDDIEALRTLCLEVVTGARITTVPAPVCADVTDNDEAPAASLPASAGGLCYIDSPTTMLSEFYIQFLADGTLRRKTLVGYSTATWLPVGADPADYEVFVDDTSDPALNKTGPAMNTWHALGVLRDFRWQALGPGPNSGFVSGTVSIRRIGEVVDDDTMEISAATFVGVNTECP